jgi:hypothetical protein
MFGIELNSNVISILALLMSFFGMIANIFYTYITKRGFEAAFFPRLSLQVLESGCGKSGLKTCLSFKLRNHSIDRTVTNLKLQAYLSHPTWKLRLWSIKWFKFFEQENIEIPPEVKKVTRPLSIGSYAEGLENFLVESFPKFVYRENDPNTPEEVAFYKKVDFLLRVHVTYEAPILNAPDIRKDYYYRLTPEFRRNNGDQYCLYYWDIKFLKAS